MLTKEAGNCIKNDHKEFKIVAMDLSDELLKENDQKKYYCVKCLIEKIGNKKIIIFEDAQQKSKILNQELLNNTQQKQKQNMESIQKLQAVIQQIQGDYLKQFEDINKQLETQIAIEGKKIEKIPESIAKNDDIKLLSNCYQEDGGLTSPSPNIDYKDIQEFIIKIKKVLSQLENFDQLKDVDKQIEIIEQTCQINLHDDEQQKKTPALNLVCEDHKTEIIMFNLNQTEFEQKNPFLCVECAQDLLTKGDKAVSNTMSLKKAEQKWDEYIKEQIEKKSQRQLRLNQAIGFIKKLQEKQNQELNKMIQSLNEQLKKQPKEYEQLMKLKNTRLLSQNKQNLLEIIKILGQTEQQKNKEELSNKEDSDFLQSQNKVLEELIKENLIVENQIQWLQNYDKLPKKSNDSDNDQEVIEFLKKSTIQDLYLNFFEMSFNSLISLKNEENTLIQKGKLEKLKQLDQEIPNEELQNQQKWYQQFQDRQAKLDRFKKVDELYSSQQQYQELQKQQKETQQQLAQLDEITKNQKQSLEKAQIQFQDINQFYEQIAELKQIYKIGNDQFEKGDTELLSKEYAQKIYRYIEEKTHKQIKNKYLIFSSKKSGLKKQLFVDSISRKSNLLMIFKSKSQSIFGGYSSCQWFNSGQNYQADQHLTSFLFSQTQNDIYALNPSNLNYAIKMDNYEIGFGQYDMKIDYQTFQSGSSKLGSTYTISPISSNWGTENLLFGSPTPNIIEVEIIMLTFF